MKMKKIILALFCGLLIFSCKNNTPENKDINDVDVKDTLTDFDRLEGKVVMATNNEWFVVKDGMKWRVNSEAASTDYLKSIENGQNNVVKNVKQSLIDQLPIGGELLPKVIFKTQSQSEIFNNKIVHSVSGEYFAIKDGQRWRLMSVAASDDFLNSIKNGKNNVLNNVPLSDISQFEVVGELLPNLVYKLNAEKSIK